MITTPSVHATLVGFSCIPSVIVPIRLWLPCGRLSTKTHYRHQGLSVRPRQSNLFISFPLSLSPFSLFFGSGEPPPARLTAQSTSPHRDLPFETTSTPTVAAIAIPSGNFSCFLWSTGGRTSSVTTANTFPLSSSVDCNQQQPSLHRYRCFPAMCISSPVWPLPKSVSLCPQPVMPLALFVPMNVSTKSSLAS